MVDGQEERKPEPATAKGRADWTRPEVDKLVAGGAEGSNDIATDGIDIPS